MTGVWNGLPETRPVRYHDAIALPECLSPLEPMMFDWLFEGRWNVYLILAIPAAILLAMWVRDRKRGWLFGLATLALLAGVYFLLDRLVETRNEQIVRRLYAMSAAVKKGDVKAIFEHISPRFQLGSLDKDGFRRSAEAAIEYGWANELPIWDVKPPDEKATVQFRAKANGNRGENQVIVRGHFGKDDDGQWRLRTFDVYNPVVDTEQPMDIGRYLPGGR